MTEYFMGIDIGTSSVRAVLFDTKGTQAAIESSECSIITNLDGMAEMEPDIIFNCFIQVVKGCIVKSGISKGQLQGMGISCQMHSLMAVDREGSPLTRLIIWADTRAQKQSQFISDNFDVSGLYNMTGCRVQHPMYPLSKLLWLKKNQPNIFGTASKFITIKEYVIHKLYAEFAVDYTLAASQGYFNIHKQQWDKEILSGILGIGTDRLSEVVECPTAFKGMKPEYAAAMGVDADTPMVIGSGDGIMANLGCGVVDGSSLSSTVGTSGAIRTASSSPLLHPRQETWCYSFTKDTWVAGGAINNGGLVLKWLREEFRKQFEYDSDQCGETIYALFDRYSSQIPPASEGLIFLPYLTGERSPDWNARARGIMSGLSYSHNRKHIIRAAMEGVMFRLFSVYQSMSDLGIYPSQIRANGGYVKSDVWLQMQADIFNKEILVSGVSEASALGAAYLAMLSAGAVKDLKRLLPCMKPQRLVHPIPENHSVYSKAYKTAMQIYEAICRCE